MLAYFRVNWILSLKNYVFIYLLYNSAFEAVFITKMECCVFEDTIGFPLHSYCLRTFQDNNIITISKEQLLYLFSTNIF